METGPSAPGNKQDTRYTHPAPFATQSAMHPNLPSPLNTLLTTTPSQPATFSSLPHTIKSVDSHISIEPDIFLNPSAYKQIRCTFCYKKNQFDRMTVYKDKSVDPSTVTSTMTDSSCSSTLLLTPRRPAEYSNQDLLELLNSHQKWVDASDYLRRAREQFLATSNTPARPRSDSIQSVSSDTTATSASLLQPKSLDAIPPHVRNSIQTRTATVLNSMLPLYVNDITESKHLVAFCQHLFTYLWMVQSTNNASSDEEELFFVRWNIEYIWRKWEVRGANVDDMSVLDAIGAMESVHNRVVLPGHVQEILDQHHIESNDHTAEHVKKAILDLAAMLAPAVVVFLSGKSPEDALPEQVDDDGDSTFNANEQMPDFLTTYSTSTAIAKDFDLIPSRLLMLLFHALDSMASLPIEETLPEAGYQVLEGLDSSCSILLGPRRAPNCFVAVIASWSARLYSSLTCLFKIASRLPFELQNPRASKMSLQIISNILSMFEECRLQIPFSKASQFNMHAYLDAIEAEIPQLNSLLCVFMETPSSLAIVHTYLDVVTILVKMILSLTVLTYRHRGDLPHYPYLADFITLIKSSFEKTVPARHPVRKIAARRIDRFRLECSRLIQLSLQNDVHCQHGGLLSMLEELGRLDDHLTRSITRSSSALDSSLPCHCNPQELKPNRYCHACRIGTRPLVPKFVLGQVFESNGSKKRDILTLDEWSKALAKKNISIPEFLDQPLPPEPRRGSRDVNAFTSINQGFSTTPIPPTSLPDYAPDETEPLDSMDLNALALETAQLISWAFADAPVSFKHD